MPGLTISPSLSLPLESATWVITYLAKRGAGKTYCAAVQAEEMVRAQVPIVVIDGMGVWYGLRVGANGHSGLPVVVFGGEHADLPLIPEKAADMAKAIVESNISCVLDLSPFSKLAARRIVSAFLNDLYRLNRIERHVFIEESDMFAPQRTIGPEEALCLSAVDNFVRRGGNHNLGCTLITQRSAVLNKDILTQSDCLVVLRTLAPQDKKAIQAWVEEQTDEDKTELNKWYDSLKTLENGEAWVWHPEKPAIFQKVKFRQRETFHATREFIKSPQASKIVLMGVDEFVQRFKKVFGTTVVGTVGSGMSTLHGLVSVTADMKELEEYRSGNRLAESVQKRLTFLGQRLEEISGQDAKLADALETAYKDLKKYEAFTRALAEILPQPVTTTIQDPGVPRTVGLQDTTTIVSVPAAEKYVTINTETMRGKILAVAKKGKLNQWRKLGEIVSAVEEEHWNAESDEVNNALTALTKEELIAKKHTDRNYFCLAQGVVFEKEEEVKE